MTSTPHARCAWCGAPARGTATANTGALTFPSCGCESDPGSFRPDLPAVSDTQRARAEGVLRPHLRRGTDARELLTNVLTALLTP